MVRRQKVVLDSDLAALYGVSTKRLNEQVRRNPTRFPADLAFQTTRDEYDGLRPQIATLEEGRGKHRKYLPWAFTEHGALMAANVLSPRAVHMSVYVVRAHFSGRESGFSARRSWSPSSPSWSGSDSEVGVLALESEHVDPGL